MKLRHVVTEGAIEGEAPGGFLLTTRTGDALSFSPGQNRSHMQGWRRFSPEGFGYLKVVEHLALDAPVEAVTVESGAVVRRYARGEDRLSISPSALIYEARGCRGQLRVDLDIRPAYETEPQGRIFRVRQEGDLILVTYEKFDDDRLARRAWAYTVAIKGAAGHRLLDRWTARTYAFDAARGEPAQQFVYEAFTIPIASDGTLVFAGHADEETARRQAEDVFAHREAILDGLAGEPDVRDAAEAVARRALESCIVTRPPHQRGGVLAGLPWFHQWWSRDELICAKGVLLSGHLDVALDIIRRYAAEILPDGRLPTRQPGTDLGSADSIGWFFVRVADVMDHVRSHHLVRQHFTREDLSALLAAIERSVEQLAMRYGREGFLTCGPLETWMDTTAGRDTREGAPIELQAFMVAGHRAAAELAEALHQPQAALHFELERNMLRRMRVAYFDGERLADRLHQGPDWTCRPNLFLAYYAAPGFLTPAEWGDVFDWALPRLWLPWGGVSTIEKGHPLYQPAYTGRDNRSYHRGDSWYFVNHLAALALLAQGHPRFLGKVAKIYEASRQALLFGEYAGHLAELSSAQRQGSEGCPAQAWSAATFLELHHALLP